MPEVLRTEIVGAQTLARPGAVLDPATAEVLAAEVAAAEARGHAAGEAAGRAAARAELDRAVAAVTDACRQVHDELREQRRTACATDLDLAAAVADAVLGRCPPDDALTVLDQVRDAVTMLDDDPLELRLHPDDLAALDGATLDPRLRLHADRTLAPGDATVRGDWGDADLRRTALTRAALAALAPADATATGLAADGTEPSSVASVGADEGTTGAEVAP